jgi:hypothetical protein
LHLSVLWRLFVCVANLLLQEFVYDLKGMRFNDVLIRRATPTWCDSWGHTGSFWGVDGLSEVSMGLAMGTEV